MAHKHNPAAFASREQLLTAARNAITRLEQIEAAVNPTNAQRDAAIKDLATYEKHLIRAFVAGV